MIADVGMFLLPYVLVFAVAYVLGFMSRNGTVDRLSADVLKLRVALSGEEIRTSRTVPDAEPVPAVQRRTGTARTQTPMFSPGHAATRTEPLPAGVQYVVTAAEEDEPMTDAEYAEFIAQYRES